MLLTKRGNFDFSKICGFVIFDASRAFDSANLDIVNFKDYRVW